MVDQRGFGDRGGFVRDTVLLVGDNGRITPQWYRALTDIYQATGLAGREYPMWNDVVVPSLSMRVPASAAPGLDTFTGGILMPSFDATAAEELHFCVQLPHAYVGGTQWHPFVHWAPSDASAGDVVWTLEYTIASVGAPFGATATVVLTSTAPGVALQHTFLEGDAVTADALRFSGIFAGRIYRDAPAGADTYAADAFLLSAGIHAMHGLPGTHQRRTPA